MPTRVMEYLMREYSIDKAVGESSAAGEFGVVFASAAEPMLVLDSDLCIAAANAAAIDALGLDAGDASKSLISFLPQGAGAPVTSLLQGVLRGTPLRRPTAVSCLRTDGAVFPAEMTAAAFESGGSQMLAVVIHDRSEADAALAALRDEHELYETLFDRSPIPLREEDFTAVDAWFTRLRSRGVTSMRRYLDEHPEELMDIIGTIKTVRVNRAMLEMMGATSMDELNSHRRAEMTDEVLASFRREFITLWNGGTTHEAEFLGLSLSGEPFECKLQLSARSQESQVDLSRVIIAIQDVTEVRAYQRSLENLIAGKDRFVASVSHELRTPLAAVLGFSQELHDNWDEFDSETARELMGLIARGAADLSTLVDDLLLAGQIDVGSGVQSNPVEFMLTDEVRRAVDECTMSGDLVAPPALDFVDVCCFADPLRVRQILRNLITNAARYGGDSVRLELIAEPRPTVRVIDNGPGIPAAEWERIFSPYQQVAGTDGARGALGLGLAISKQLADVMHGDLSYHHGDGLSVFTLTLPTTADAASGLGLGCEGE